MKALGTDTSPTSLSFPQFRMCALETAATLEKPWKKWSTWRFLKNFNQSQKELVAVDA